MNHDPFCDDLHRCICDLIAKVRIDEQEHLMNDECDCEECRALMDFEGTGCDTPRA
jgi:hypothetical protein